MLAEARRGERKIGTTSRGIGPAYEDKIGRRGIRVGDLADAVDRRPARERRARERRRAQSPRRQHGHEVAGRARRSARRRGRGCSRSSPTRRCICTARWREGKRVMFEGAQGTLLDIDHGTYPFVTSSNATAGGAATGLGVGPTRDRRGARRRQGLHDARRRRAAADGAASARWASGCARRGRSTARPPAGRAAAAGTTPSPCATPRASTASTRSRITKLDVLDGLDELRGLHGVPLRRRHAHRNAGRHRAAGGLRADLRDDARLDEPTRGITDFAKLPTKRKALHPPARRRSAASRRRSSRPGPRRDSHDRSREAI